jgi:hypothetical protein
VPVIVCLLNSSLRKAKTAYVLTVNLQFNVTRVPKPSFRGLFAPEDEDATTLPNPANYSPVDKALRAQKTTNFRCRSINKGEKTNGTYDY